MPHTRTQHAHPQRPPDPTAGLPPLPRHAAGIDVGRAAPDVAVPPDRSPAPVRRLARLTADLPALADWLQACHLDPVVLDRTGGDGLPRCHILDARGGAVHVVNARHANNLPGRPPDIADGPWRPHLHPVGLLHRSGRPPAALGV
jgi:hypothetical protein